MQWPDWQSEPWEQDSPLLSGPVGKGIDEGLVELDNEEVCVGAELLEWQ